MNMKNDKKAFAIILARMGSSRLPGKVMKEILGVPVLKILIERIKESRLLDGIVVATTINKEDNLIEEFCKKNSINIFRGSEKDILERIYLAAKNYKAEIIVEQGADCPLVDSELIDSGLEFYFNSDFDYVTTLHNNRSGPHGYFLRVCPINLLEEVYNTTTTAIYDREDSLFYIESHPEIYRIGNFIPDKETHSKNLRLTIDNPKDFELIRLILEHFNSIKIPMKDIVRFLKEKPELNFINKTVHHTEYRLYRIGIIGDYKLNDDVNLLLNNLSKYKKINEYLSASFKFVALSHNKDIEEIKEKLNIKRFYRDHNEMLEKENLDILITPIINLDLIKRAIKNRVIILLTIEANMIPNEIINICKENNIKLLNMKFNELKEILYETRRIIDVYEL